jgi:hypothetical protein
MIHWITTTLLLIPFLLTAQSGGTTLDEYRYLTKGYAYQKSMGLDASKEGYLLKDLAPANTETGFIALYKNGQQQARGILLILQKNKVQPTYLCLPNNQADESVVQLQQTDLQALTDPALKNEYQLALQQLAFYVLESAEQNNGTAFAKTETGQQPLQQKGIAQEANAAASAATITAEDQIQTYDFQDKAASTEAPETGTNTAVAFTMDEHMVQRTVLKAPVIEGNFTANGKVAIKFCVDVNGDVSSAKFTQLGSTTFNEALIEQARAAVLKAQFAEAAAEGCGKVVFHFQ